MMFVFTDWLGLLNLPLGFCCLLSVICGCTTLKVDVVCFISAKVGLSWTSIYQVLFSVDSILMFFPMCNILSTSLRPLILFSAFYDRFE